MLTLATFACHVHLKMDHLPQASNSAFPYPRVPILEGFVYDDGGFTGFPARMGFDKKRLLAGDFAEHSSTITAAFLQSWLYFGMMSEVLGIHVERADFIVDDHQGQSSITSKPSLLLYIQRWLATLADKLPADFFRIARSYPAVRYGLAHCGEERRGRAKTPADYVADPNGECG